MIKLGFSTLGCPDYSVDQVIAMARDHGYAGVEIRFLRGQVDLTALDELSPERIGETRQRFADAGVQVVCVGSSVRMASLDVDERREQLRTAQQYSAIAAGLGAPYLRVFGGPIPEGQDADASIDAIVAGLNRVAELSDAHGVQTLLETHDEFNTGAVVTNLFRRGLADRVGVLWDSLHTYRNGEPPALTWERIGARVRHVHVKDSHRFSPDFFDLALTGSGTMPIGDVVTVLQEAGYDGFVDFEWEKAWHPEIEEPEIAIPQFIQYLRRLI